MIDDWLKYKKQKKNDMISFIRAEQNLNYFSNIIQSFEIPLESYTK